MNDEWHNLTKQLDRLEKSNVRIVFVLMVVIAYVVMLTVLVSYK